MKKAPIAVEPLVLFFGLSAAAFSLAPAIAQKLEKGKKSLVVRQLILTSRLPVYHL
jgi:hypothetical protein